MNEKKKEYDLAYQKTLAQIPIKVSKEYKSQVDQKAKEAGIPTRQYILGAIDKRMNEKPVHIQGMHINRVKVNGAWFNYELHVLDNEIKIVVEITNDNKRIGSDTYVVSGGAGEVAKLQVREYAIEKSKAFIEAHTKSKNSEFNCLIEEQD